MKIHIKSNYDNNAFLALKFKLYRVWIVNPKSQIFEFLRQNYLKNSKIRILLRKSKSNFFLAFFRIFYECFNLFTWIWKVGDLPLRIWLVLDRLNTDKISLVDFGNWSFVLRFMISKRSFHFSEREMNARKFLSSNNRVSE